MNIFYRRKDNIKLFTISPLSAYLKAKQANANTIASVFFCQILVYKLNDGGGIPLSKGKKVFYSMIHLCLHPSYVIISLIIVFNVISIRAKRERMQKKKLVSHKIRPLSK